MLTICQPCAGDYPLERILAKIDVTDFWNRFSTCNSVGIVETTESAVYSRMGRINVVFILLVFGDDQLIKLIMRAHNIPE